MTNMKKAMKQVLKQVLGIDVAQHELVVCLGRVVEGLLTELCAHKTFANTAKGFELMLAWAGELAAEGAPVRYVMEATGVYHEGLAYFLADRGLDVSIVMPNKMSSYMRTLDVKTVTDKTASEAIARFGLEKSLSNWHRPSPAYKKIRQLTRERDQLVQERSMAKNQLHAEKAEAEPNGASIKRISQRIAFLDGQEKEVRAEVAALVKSDEKASRMSELFCSVPGVGALTAATVIGETNGSGLIRNKKQLASYAGLDVKEKRSGTSVNGKPRISKSGNRFLRKCLHLPSLAAVRCDERFNADFERIAAKHGIKMKALVAVQRKLLEMMYTLHTTNEKYDKGYLQKKEAEKLKAQNKEAA
jgi:transposase